MLTEQKNWNLCRSRQRVYKKQTKKTTTSISILREGSVGGMAWPSGGEREHKAGLEVWGWVWQTGGWNGRVLQTDKKQEGLEQDDSTSLRSITESGGVLCACTSLFLEQPIGSPTPWRTPCEKNRGFVTIYSISTHNHPLQFPFCINVVLK